MIWLSGTLLLVLLQLFKIATTEEVQVAASVGEEAELPCKTTATVGSITWYVGKVDSETADDDTKVLSALLGATTQPPIRLPNFRYDVVTRSLYIRNVSLDQDGYFTCAINAFLTSARVQRKHIRLTVYVFQGTPTLEGLDLPVTEKEQLTLHCTVDRVKPDNVTFEWSYGGNGNVIEGGRSGTSLVNEDRTYKVRDTIHLSFVRRDNGDRLMCRVTHGIKPHTTEVSKKISIQYKYITSVLDPDPSVKPIRNRSKTLECQIDERGSPENSTILWLRGTTRLQDSTKYSGLGSDSLTINNLENGDDQSEYNCRVDNQAGAGKQGDPYTLVLLYPPQITLTQPDPVQEGSPDLSIVCNVNAKPRRLTYIRLSLGGTTLEEKTNTDDTTLVHTIAEVDRQHKGAYICEAQNEIDVGRGSVNLTVYYQPVGTPTITASNMVILVGKQATLTCDLSQVDLGHPPAKTIIWYKGETEWKSGESNTVTEDFPTVQNASSFYCQVKNVHGKSDKSGPLAIKVEVPVDFETSKVHRDFTPLYNDTSFTVSYMVSGSNIDSVTWYNSSKLVSSHDFTYKMEDIQGAFSFGQTTAVNASLSWNLPARFTCANIEDFTDNYHITARGVAAGEPSETTAIFSITVEYPPIQIGRNATVYSAPGKEAVITCKVCANPQAEYKWTFNNKQDLPGETSENGTKLTITHVEMHHFTKFKCTATNKYGTTVVPIMLQQKGPPHEANNFRVNSRTSQTLRVSWTAGNDGGYPNMILVLEWKPEGGRSWDHFNHADCRLEGQSCSRRIRNLTPNTTYRLRVRPKTEKPGDEYGPYVKLKTGTRVQPDVSKPVVEVTETELKVTWNYTAAGRRRRQTDEANYDVAVRVRYQRVDGGEAKEFPQDGTKIPARNQKAAIDGTFNPQVHYNVALDVYEADIYEATYTEETLFKPYMAAASSQSSTTIGLVVGFLVITALIVAVAILVWKRRKGGKRMKVRKNKTGRNSGYYQVQETTSIDSLPITPTSPLVPEATDDVTVTNGLIDTTKDPGGRGGPGDGEANAVQCRPPVARPRTSRKSKMSQKNNPAHGPPSSGQPGPPPYTQQESPYANTPAPPRLGQKPVVENPYVNVNMGMPPADGVYENVDVNHYQNVVLPVAGASSTDDKDLYDEVSRGQEGQLNVGPDGTIYTDVCFGRGREAQPVSPPQIHGLDDRVTYAKVDFDKMRELQQKQQAEFQAEDQL